MRAARPLGYPGITQTGNTCMAQCSSPSILLSFPEREQKTKREGNDKTPARS